MRGQKRGSMPLDVPGLREILADGKVWTGLGVVVKRKGDSSHFEIERDPEFNDPTDVLVEVDLMPDEIPLTCRLGTAGGGGRSIGYWRVPPVGTEVVVILPQGELDFMPVIVSSLASGNAPSNGSTSLLDEDVTLVVNTKKIRVISTAEDVFIEAPTSGKKVKIGGDTGLEPAVLGDQLTTRLESIEDALSQILDVLPGHTHAETGGTTDASSALSDLSEISLSTPNVKASKVEVK